jgi:hypothetical protein
MRIFYDCEFREDGRVIDLISIGMVAEDGRELYAVNADAPFRRRWWTPWRRSLIERHPWLMDNVVPHLPKAYGDARNHMPRRWLFNYDDPSVKPRRGIAAEVQAFIQATPNAELWAYYGAYDHVVLCQLWGRMIDLPEGVPMWTNDLKQEVVRLGNPALPKQEGAEHNALADARWVRDAYAALKETDAADG